MAVKRRGEVRPISDLPASPGGAEIMEVEVAGAFYQRAVPAGGGGGSWGLWYTVGMQVPMTGANGGTVFTDDTGKAVTRTGVTTDTSTAPTGFTSSTLFSGGTDKLSLASDEDFRLGSTHWQLEGWFKTTQATQDATLAERSTVGFNSGSWALLINTNAANDGKVSWWQSDINNAAPVLTSTAAYNDGAWHHVAVVRIGNMFYLWIDGVRVAAATNGVGIFGEPAQALLFGNSVFAGRGFNGHLVAFRLMRGAITYSRTPFTVPSGPFPTS